MPKNVRLGSSIGGFTRVELLTVIALIALLVLIPGLVRAKARAQRINCTNNLKQIGLAFKTWALDRQDSFPMSVSTNLGGSKEYIETGEVFRHFQVMLNHFADPRLLICPADVRQPARDLAAGLSNSNLSYFVGLDATDTNPSMLLYGDRNLTNGPLPPNHVLVPSPNFPVRWTHEMHHYQGNIGLADGSVQQFSSSRLNEVFRSASQRLAMP